MTETTKYQFVADKTKGEIRLMPDNLYVGVFRAHLGTWVIDPDRRINYTLANLLVIEFRWNMPTYWYYADIETVADMLNVQMKLKWEKEIELAGWPS